MRRAILAISCLLLGLSAAGLATCARAQAGAFMMVSGGRTSIPTEEVGSESANLCWTQPSTKLDASGLSDLTSNRIWFREDGTAENVLIDSVIIDAPAGEGEVACYPLASIAALEEGTTYLFRIQAVDSTGTAGLLSEEFEAECCGNDGGWAAAIADSDVTMATRFDTEDEVTDWVFINGTEDRVSWDTTTRLGSTGGSLRFDVLDIDEAASGLWGRFLADDERVFGNGDTYYVRYSWRADENMLRYWPQENLAFDAGTTAFLPTETVTGGTSGATATIARVQLVSGAWNGTAVGGLPITGRSGNFVENETITSASGHATTTRWGFPSDIVGSGGGFKLSIFSWHNQSAATNEVVTQDTLDRRYFQMYNQDGTSFPPLRDPVSTPCNGSNFQLQGAIDTGSPSTPANCTQYANRYGPLYDYGSGSDNPDANDITTQGHPRTEAATSGVSMEEDVWYTLLTKVAIGTLGTASTAIDQWIQRPGDADYTHVHSYTGVTLSTAHSGHDYVFLLPYETGKQPGSKGHDGVVWYDEVIVSESTIPARGL